MKTLPKDKFISEYDIEQLKALSTFGALNAEFIRYIIANCEIVSATTGELLFAANSITTEFYIIVNGSVRVHNKKADEQGISNRFFVGEGVGFISMLCMQKWDGDVTVEKDATLIKIDNQLFSSLPDRNGEQFSIFLINLARNIGRAYLRRL